MTSIRAHIYIHNAWYIWYTNKERTLNIDYAPLRTNYIFTKTVYYANSITNIRSIGVSDSSNTCRVVNNVAESNSQNNFGYERLFRRKKIVSPKEKLVYTYSLHLTYTRTSSNVPKQRVRDYIVTNVLLKVSASINIKRKHVR